MSKRLAEEMCAAWTTRTGIPTIVLRPVMILTDEKVERMAAHDAELGAFVGGNVRLILCGPGDFDASEAERVLGWRATRHWLR